MVTGPVLLVHDDIASIAAIRRLLSREGREIVLATSAAEAISVARALSPTLVILAPEFDGGRGPHVVSALRELSPGVGLVLLGAKVEGVEAPVIPEPLDAELLLASVREALTSPAVSAPTSSVPPQRDAHGDVTALEHQLFGDLPLDVLEAQLQAEVERRERVAPVAPVAPAPAVATVEPEPAAPEPPKSLPTADVAAWFSEPAPAFAPAPAPASASSPAADVGSSDRAPDVVALAGAAALGAAETFDAPPGTRDGAETVRAGDVDPALVAARALAEAAEEKARLLERLSDAEREERARVEAELAEARARNDALATDLRAAKVEAEHARLEAERRGAAAQEVEARRQSGEARWRDELEQARAEVARVRAEAEELARRAAGRVALRLPIAEDVPERRSTGTVDTVGLCRLIADVAIGRLDVRVDLDVPEGRRSIWLSRGLLAGASSSIRGETLVERARRDGLIDAAQVVELNGAPLSSTAAALGALRALGLIRDAERVPLVQRYIEQVALDALVEPSSRYRLSAEKAPEEVVPAVAPRAALALVAEALRASVQPDEGLSALGGMNVKPTLLLTRFELEALGLDPRELRLLRSCAGTASLEELTLDSGLRVDAVLRLLFMAHALELVSLAPEEASAPGPSAEIDAERLRAKLKQVHDADYFTILGLARTARGPEVERAFQQLSMEFHPLKYLAHEDPALARGAQELADLLSEAATALADDRLRSEYLRHLVE